MIPVVVLGASRLMGQAILSRLVGHPTFAIHALCDLGADRPPKAFGEVCNWVYTPEMPEPLRHLPHHCGTAAALATCGGAGLLVLSGLADGQSAGVDRAFANAGSRVITHASDLRLDAEVPLVIPDIHPVASDASIVATPNCTTVMAGLFLHAIHAQFGIESVSAITLQALSGADLTGPSALEMNASLDPHLQGEARALEAEIDRLFSGAFPISVQSARVPVSVGHTLFLSFKTKRPATQTDIKTCLSSFELTDAKARLPSALRRPLIVEERAGRPTPRLDAGRERGMAITIGSLETCPVQGWRCVLVGNNMERGSAATLLLAAEAMAAETTASPNAPTAVAD